MNSASWLLRRAAEAEEALRILRQHVDSAAASLRTPSTERTFSIKQTSSPQLPLNVNPHSSRRLASICSKLAPAVAVRPAPLQASFAAQHAVRYSPWLWGSSSARLTFDPDGIVGALSTPWGDDGRWGSLPRAYAGPLALGHICVALTSSMGAPLQYRVPPLRGQPNGRRSRGSASSARLPRDGRFKRLNESERSSGGESASVDDDDDDEDDEGDDV